MPIKRAEDAVLDYDTTILPPKKYFMPQRETLFTYSSTGAEPEVPENSDTGKRVIFGVHTYDLHGIDVLKKVFYDSEQPDPYFTELYDRTYLVGIDFEDDKFKFAHDMQSDGLNCSYDLYIGRSFAGSGNAENNKAGSSSIDLGTGSFILLLGREQGNELLKGIDAADNGWHELSADELLEYMNDRAAYLEKQEFKLLATLDEMPQMLSAMLESDVWKSEADKCFSCGSCNTTCPTCYCFDIRDIPDIGEDSGKRTRIWDSCMLSTFAKVAGGENFRRETYERLRHRFNRKIWYLRNIYGRPACVGCGRCSRACMASINISVVLNALESEYARACAVDPDFGKLSKPR